MYFYKFFYSIAITSDTDIVSHTIYVKKVITLLIKSLLLINFNCINQYKKSYVYLAILPFIYSVIDGYGNLEVSPSISTGN